MTMLNPPVQVIPPGVSGKARGKKAEVAPAIYSQGHDAYFALPAEVRSKFTPNTRHRLSQGLFPDGPAMVNFMDLGIDPRLFRLPGTRLTADGSPLATGGNLSAWARKPTIETTERGKAILARVPGLTQDALQAAMGLSAERLRACLKGLESPTLAEAIKAQAVGVPLEAWGSPDAAAIAARKAARAAKRAAKAGAGPNHATA